MRKQTEKLNKQIRMINIVEKTLTKRTQTRPYLWSCVRFLRVRIFSIDSYESEESEKY